MARADRLERLDSQRSALELEYRECLIAALRQTAAGSWGLFGHNEHLARHHAPPAEVSQLCDMGDEVNVMRERLDMAPFALHEEFLASRGRVKPDAVGEPKQAQAWLDRLARAHP